VIRIAVTVSGYCITTRCIECSVCYHDNGFVRGRTMSCNRYDFIRYHISKYLIKMYNTHRCTKIVHSTNYISHYSEEHQEDITCVYPSLASCWCSVFSSALAATIPVLQWTLPSHSSCDQLVYNLDSFTTLIYMGQSHVIIETLLGSTQMHGTKALII